MSPRTVPTASIAIGERDRVDMGDIAALAESISAVGLLHPVVVTEAMTLVAGGRRLEAAKSLGWSEVPVTVVDLSNVADALRAEADENTQRKPLTPVEAAQARERRSRVLAEDAKRRQGARTDLQPSPNLGESPLGPELPVPARVASLTRAGSEDRKARETAKVAALGTGYSSSTLDKVDRIRTVAERGVVPVGRGKERREEPAPESVREVAKKALEEVKQTGAAVDRAHRAVAEAMDKFLPPDPDAPHRKWRQEFLTTLGGARKPMRFTPEDIVERADDECLDELRRLVDDMANHYSRVRNLAERSTPDNVRKLRAV